MSATVQINEFNGAGETKTANITNSNLGSSDSVNLNASANPIIAGSNSFEKWQKIEVTALGGSSAIDNLKTWMTGSLSGSDALKTNARTATYGGAETYGTPVASTSSKAAQTMPIAEPASANLGIGGSLTGSITAVGSSDYLVMQLQTDAATTAGASLTIHYQYDETA